MLDGVACQALDRMPRYLPEGLPGPKLKGVDMCNNRKPWEVGWEGVFDSSVGPTLATERRNIMGASLKKCIRNFEEVRQ